MPLFNFKKQQKEEPIDIKNWINEHRSWKNLLETHINNGGTSLTLKKAMSEKDCPLGQWIHGTGQKYNESPLYNSLKKQHAEFHKYAGTVFLLAEENKDDEAEKILYNEFTQISAKLSNTLTQIQVHLSFTK